MKNTAKEQPSGDFSAAKTAGVALQLRSPNFRDKRGQLFLVRCFVCEPDGGRENYHAAIAAGECAWCGWKQENI